VGGKCAALRLCGKETGFITVTSRRPKPGLVRDTCTLEMNKDICRKRDAEARRIMALPDAAARAAAEATQRSMFDYGGGENAPGVVHRGEEAAPDGGAWHGSGTLVEAHDLDAALMQKVTAAGGLFRLGRLFAEVYNMYLFDDTTGALCPLPLPPGAPGHVAASTKGKARASAAADAPRPRPPVSIFVGVGGADMVDVSTLTDNMVSRMLQAGARSPADVFELGIAMHDGSAVTQARLRLFYHPYVCGEATLPTELRERRMGSAHVLKVRCGRLLMLNSTPATLAVPQLQDTWARDGGPKTTRAMRARRLSRFLSRVSGIIYFGANTEPLKNKSCLKRATCARCCPRCSRSARPTPPRSWPRLRLPARRSTPACATQPPAAPQSRRAGWSATQLGTVRWRCAMRCLTGWTVSTRRATKRLARLRQTVTTPWR
jgi:hypothetical protein